jgi:Putative Flp pilus-assembly TadE/G-like
VSLSPSSTSRTRSERGQVTAFFALLIPVLFAIGAIVIDIGNWYVHKRHLQTQVDAAVLAAGTQFTTCGDPTFPTNANIRDEALEYAGDTIRDPATTNLQLQEPDDVRVVLNSANYWGQGDPPDYWTAHDDTIDPDGDPLTPGDPCYVKFLDAKATDDEAPPLWGLIPLSPSPKTHAKVRIVTAKEARRVLPWAVPEVDPLAVAAIFIDEETGLVLEPSVPLVRQTTAPPGLTAFNVWRAVAADMDVTSQNIGVVILVSKNASPSLPAEGSQPDAACDAPNVDCYSPGGPGSSYDTGLSFIHGYDDAIGAVQAAVVKDVQLFAVDCAATDPDNLSAAYFTRTGPCTASVQAVVSFGFGGGEGTDCPPANQNAEVRVNGSDMSCSGGVWSGSVSLPVDQGRQTVDLDWETNPPGPGRWDGDFPKVAAPYIRETESLTPGLFSPSGPVEYLELGCLSSVDVTCPGILANSLPDETASLQGPMIQVTVGLAPPLTSGQKVVMRLASGSNDSKTQALDCDANRKFDEEIVTGCLTPFSVNYDQSTGTWRDIDCVDYKDTSSPTYRYPLPVDAPYDPTPRPDCARVEPGGKLGLFRKAMDERFESPCTPMNWPNPPADDKRWVTLVITDATAFRGSGGSPDDSIPVKILGSFYVSGWTTGGVANGCVDNEPPPPGNFSGNSGDVWGYFRVRVLPSSGGAPSTEDCNFDGNEVCIAALVE